eukprot:TRINITY_DN1840_c0_g1_i1.p1 TRINITY_DN1840_c0_g1~~TRINITY_DN1840_c0_g1_i1.p1  ORF type:complete len:63 (-),score=2.20 TRINITY_DN1840_c0_g1_i1:202-390(-)
MMLVNKHARVRVVIFFHANLLGRMIYSLFWHTRSNILHTRFDDETLEYLDERQLMNREPEKL